MVIEDMEVSLTVRFGLSDERQSAGREIGVPGLYQKNGTVRTGAQYPMATVYQRCKTVVKYILGLKSEYKYLHRGR